MINTSHNSLDLPMAGHAYKHVLHIDEVLWNLETRHRIVRLDTLDLASLDLSRDERRFLRQFHAAIVWDTDDISFHESPESLQRRLHTAR